jgi:ADP-ribose pyrophosphatase
VGSFPAPGAFPESHIYAACDISGLVATASTGDGHPLEEGSWVRYVPLDDAIQMCVRGEIRDGKTEIALRRLRDRLASGA